MAPIDKELIDLKILNNTETNWLNNYHKKVFNNLQKFMNKAELVELAESMGVSTSGTKKDLIEAILGA